MPMVIGRVYLHFGYPEQPMNSPKRPLFFTRFFPAQRTQFGERLIGLVRDARALNKAAGGLAVRVTGAGEEGAEAPALDGHLLAAVVAILGFRFAAGFFGKFRGEVLNEIAFGIA